MNRFNQSMYFILAFIITQFLTGCGGSSSDPILPDALTPDASIQDAVYSVKFTSNWTSDSFPTNFPTDKEHFSPLVGAVHSKDLVVWKTGEPATAGIKLVAETGSTSTIKEEINIAKLHTTVSELIECGVVGECKITLTKTFPLVSIVTMVAPSPDWFVGVRDLSLYDDVNKKWKSEFSADLKVYDSGTDSGDTFKASDQETHPFDVIKLLTTDAADTDFEDGVHRTNQKFIAKMVFTKEN